MDTRETVRERRQARIRALMSEAPPQVEPKAGRGVSPSEPGRQAVVDKPPQGRKEDDPELLWKSRPNPWLGWQVGREEDGGELPPPARPGPGQWVKELQVKIVISLALLGCGWGLFQLDMPWARTGQSLVGDMLTVDMDFSAAAAWYDRTFAGSPAFIPIFGDREQAAERAQAGIRTAASPVTGGVIVRDFATLSSGVELAAESGAEVRSIGAGRVLIVSDESGQGQTVIIQHAQQRMSVYGRLGMADVEPGDWVESGEAIGRLQTGEDDRSVFYFAVRERERYVDPADVIAFD